jgi:protein SCO1/2
MDKKKLILGGLIAIVVLAIAGAEMFVQAYKFRGSAIDPPVAASNFTLKDQNGQTFQLGDQRGKIVLMFFGYTNCPDVCPTTLLQFKQARAQLGPSGQANRVRFVFITVDPERDTAEKMKTYLGAIDPAIIGLGGSQAELESVWKAYGVYRQKQPGQSPDEYADLIEHSGRVYLIDAQGNLRLTYPFGLQPDDVVQDVTYLLKQK